MGLRYNTGGPRYRGSTVSDYGVNLYVQGLDEHSSLTQKKLKIKENGLSRAKGLAKGLRPGSATLTVTIIPVAPDPPSKPRAPQTTGSSALGTSSISVGLWLCALLAQHRTCACELCPVDARRRLLPQRTGASPNYRSPRCRSGAKYYGGDSRTPLALLVANL